MIAVVRGSWPLFLGILLLMLGNALQGSLLGVRSVFENFSTEAFGYISAGYFIGFLGGSLLTPRLIRSVGHVRVFAAFGSLISAAFIAYAAVVDPVAWFLMRFVVGFCFSGVYIVAESWLNETSANADRGKAMSAYMITQMTGMVLGQQLLNVGDPKGYELFVLISILVSLSIAPILLSVVKAPGFGSARPMTFRQLFDASPLGMVGGLLNGAALSVLFGMTAVYGALLELTIAEISILASATFAGGALLQYPIGVISDRMDRRLLIIIIGAVGAAACVIGAATGRLELGAVGEVRLFAVYGVAVFAGGAIISLYGLLIAHTNDFLENDQRAAAASGFTFVVGLGSSFGPIAAGYAMTLGGAGGFWLITAATMAGVALYGLYRATQRAATPAEETAPYAAVGVRMTRVAAGITQEAAVERWDEEEARAEAEAEADRADGGGDGGPVAPDPTRPPAEDAPEGDREPDPEVKP
ncbi:MAG: MFS transporter [Pseudomonadota bacterium]